MRSLLAAPSADYTGPAVRLAERLAEVAHGGQVLLSEEAWQGVQDLLQVCDSLAYHALPIMPHASYTQFLIGLF